jgi:hypothetical protein
MFACLLLVGGYPSSWALVGGVVRPCVAGHGHCRKGGDERASESWAEG